MIRVLLVEDHPAVRLGIQQILQDNPDIQVVDAATNGPEGIYLAISLAPDVLILDIRLPGFDGVEVARQLRSRGVRIPTLILTGYLDLGYLQSFLALGVEGYLLKDEAPERIVEGVRQLMAGEKGWYSQKVANLISELWSPEPTHQRFSDQERQILARMAQGETNREIAFELHMSMSSVEKACMKLLKKLKVTNRTEAAVKAIREKLV